MEGENEGDDCIPRHLTRGLDAENIVYLSVLVISQAILISWYQYPFAVIKVSNMVESYFPDYGL